MDSITMQRQEDTELIRRLKEGSQDAFSQIYEKYSPDVIISASIVLGNRQSAEDISQDLFAQIWQKRESLVITSNLRAYLTTAARNLSLNRILQEKTHQQRNQGYSNRSEKVEHPSVHIENELMDKVNEALKDISPKRLKAFNLVVFEENSHKEAAQITGASENTIKVHVHGVMKMLRSKLTRKMLFFL